MTSVSDSRTLHADLRSLVLLLLTALSLSLAALVGVAFTFHTAIWALGW